MHPGALTHFHEGLPTTKGTRYILVSFVSSKYGDCYERHGVFHCLGFERTTDADQPYDPYEYQESARLSAEQEADLLKDQDQEDKEDKKEDKKKP